MKKFFPLCLFLVIALIWTVSIAGSLDRTSSATPTQLEKSASGIDLNKLTSKVDPEASQQINVAARAPLGEQALTQEEINKYRSAQIKADGVIDPSERADYERFLSEAPVEPLPVPLNQVSESEPNDDCGSANAIACGDTVWCADIDYSGDEADYYTFTLDNTYTYWHVVLETLDPAGLCDSVGVGDTKLYLFNSDCSVQLAYNDDIGYPNYYSLIDINSLTPGTYVAEVTGYSTSTMGSYHLSVLCDEGTGPIPGDNCSLPIFIPSIPYTDLNQTTCGRGDNVNGTSCLGYYDGGEDIFYEFTLAEESYVEVTIDFKSTTWSGFCVDDNCPPDGDCNAVVTGSGSGVKTTGTLLLPAGTYYIMADTWPTPDCIADFDLSIDYIIPCDVVCNPSWTTEGEPLCGEDYIDSTNGGCNDTLQLLWSPLTPGDTVCGETGTYIWHDSTGAPLQYRDTDWYEFTTTIEAVVSMTCVAEVPLQTILMTPGSPNPCSGYSYVVGTAGDCDTLTISLGIVPPGTYWAWVGPSVFTGVACGSEYWFVVSAEEPVGRCCYNSNLNCDDVSEDACTALNGEWTYGLNCTDNPCYCPEDSLSISITTDGWPSEVSWELLDNFTGDTVASVPSGYYSSSYTTYSYYFCMNTTDCYDFFVHDVYGDGGGPVSISLNGNLVWSHSGNYGYGTSISELGHGCLVPDIVVTPSSITGEADPGFSDIDSVSIGNAGDDTLFYTVSAVVNPAVTRFDGTVEQLYEVGDFRVDRVPLGYYPVEDKVKAENPGANLQGEPYFPPMQLSVGGPDAYGYTWIDSDEPGGPTYGWVDISGVGTVIPLTDDSNQGPFSLGFSVDYYGTSFNSIRVCSNGWASFTSTSASLSNVGIPSSGEPNNGLFIFWDDLNPGAGGTVYYYADGANSRFIISYVGVPHYGGSGSSLTFEIIINSDGSIVYQYDVMDHAGHIVGASVGIENGDGTVGLQYDYNSDPFPPHDYLAILFEPPTFWLTVDSESGTIPQLEGPDIVHVNMDATELTAGIYTGSVVINSNDLDEPEITVPVTFYVGGLGTLSGQVTDANTTLPLENAIITVTLMSATTVVDTTDASGNYSIDITAGSVLCEIVKECYVTDSENMTIIENQTLAHDCAMNAADASMDETPVVDTLAPGDTMVCTKTLTNAGTAPLDYSVSLSFDVGPGMTANGISFITERVANNADPMGAADVAPYSFNGGNLPIITDFMDSVFYFNPETQTGDLRCLGVEFDGTYFWVTGAGPLYADSLHKFDRDGNFVASYPQGTSTDWGWRDLAWDGTYLYGSDSYSIIQVDVTGGVPVPTGTVISGPVTPNRALAYDPATDHFWVANYSSDIYEIDRTGAIINSYTNTKSVYGMAWDDITEGGPYIWVFAQEGVYPIQHEISQFDPATGTYTGIAWDGYLPSGYTTAIAGGVCFTTEWNPTLGVLFTLTQGDNDFVMGYEIAPNATWIKVQSGGSGTIAPSETADIEFLIDFRDSTIVPDSTYQAVAMIGNNDPYADPDFLFSITALGGGDCCDYAVGDVNGSNNYNGLDITYGVAFFKGGPGPMCNDCSVGDCNTFNYCGDVNGSNSYNGLDITYGVAYFKGGPGPVFPPDCPPCEGIAGGFAAPPAPSVIKTKPSIEKKPNLK